MAGLYYYPLGLEQLMETLGDFFSRLSLRKDAAICFDLGIQAEIISKKATQSPVIQLVQGRIQKLPRLMVMGG